MRFRPLQIVALAVSLLSLAVTALAPVAVPLGVAVVATAPEVARADNLLTNENLVQTTPTKLHTYNFRRAILITNNGPNRIWCALGSSSLAVINKAQPIDANGGFWSLPLPATIDIWCIAETANQVTGAATVTSEVP